MNSHLHHQSQSQGNRPLKPRKKRLARDQLNLLETSFNANQKLKAEHKTELARQLGVPPKQVAIWYQNRRARHKNDAIEHDYMNIQLELGNVLAENIRLEKQVSMLKFELNKVQQMILFGPTSSAATLPSVSGSSDEQANSSSPGNMICNWGDAGNDDMFPVEELYTCLIGSDTQLWPLNWTSESSIMKQVMTAECRTSEVFPTTLGCLYFMVKSRNFIQCSILKQVEYQ